MNDLGNVTDLRRLPHANISFLANDGSLPSRSGLNWGQRPEANREPNQAYIRVPSSVYDTQFFPPRGRYFSIHTDDGHVFQCSIAQDNSKAIHTPQNNSEFGIYFRNRIGIPLGSLVEKNDLISYGRTDLDFYKIDDYNYFMDFSYKG